MNLTAAYGLLAHGLIFGALAALLPLGALRQRVVLTATATALLVGIAPAMHGLFGTPSATLLQLAILQVAGRSPSPFTKTAAASLLILALCFYPLALGWGPFDPYALGYQPAPLLAALLVLGVALWWRRQHSWLAIIGLDLLAYSSGIFANLWDALFDPLLVLLALAIVARQGAMRFIASRNR